MASDSGVHFHTITGEHPKHGKYELTFRVIDESQYGLVSDQSTFPVEGHEERMECVEHAGDFLTAEQGVDSVLVDEETL
jgi:hypothetical protein